MEVFEVVLKSATENTPDGILESFPWASDLLGKKWEVVNHAQDISRVVWQMDAQDYFVALHGFPFHPQRPYALELGAGPNPYTMESGTFVFPTSIARLGLALGPERNILGGVISASGTFDFDAEGRYGDSWIRGESLSSGKPTKTKCKYGLFVPVTQISLSRLLSVFRPETFLQTELSEREILKAFIRKVATRYSTAKKHKKDLMKLFHPALPPIDWNTPPTEV